MSDGRAEVRTTGEKDRRGDGASAIRDAAGLLRDGVRGSRRELSAADGRRGVELQSSDGDVGMTWTVRGADATRISSRRGDVSKGAGECNCG